MYERTITIDIDRPYTSRIPSVQCDSGRKVKVKLTNQGKPMDLTDTRVVLACVKPDGHEIFNDTEIVDKTKGEVTFALTEQINAEVGQVRSVLKLYDGETLVTSKEFFISVDASVGTSVASSSDELNALTKAINEVQDIDNRFAKTNAQLSDIENNKMNKGGEIVVSQINKNKGKLDQTYMSDEFLKQIAGTTAINATPANGSVTTEKLANNSVDKSKLQTALQPIGILPGKQSELPNFDGINQRFTIPQGQFDHVLYVGGTAYTQIRNVDVDLTIPNGSSAGKLIFNTLTKTFRADIWNATIDSINEVVVAYYRHYNQEYNVHMNGPYTVNNALPNLIDNIPNNIMTGTIMPTKLLPDFDTQNHTLTIKMDGIAPVLFYGAKQYVFTEDVVVNINSEDVSSTSARLVLFNSKTKLFYCKAFYKALLNEEVCVAYVRVTGGKYYISCNFPYTIDGKTPITDQSINLSHMENDLATELNKVVLLSQESDTLEVNDAELWEMGSVITDNDTWENNKNDSKDRIRLKEVIPISSGRYVLKCNSRRAFTYKIYKDLESKPIDYPTWLYNETTFDVPIGGGYIGLLIQASNTSVVGSDTSLSVVPVGYHHKIAEIDEKLYSVETYCTGENVEMFQQGLYANNNAWENNTNNIATRIKSIKPIPLLTGTTINITFDNRKFDVAYRILKYPSGVYDGFDSGWLSNSTVSIPYQDENKHIGLMVRRKDNSDISPEDLPETELVVTIRTDELNKIQDEITDIERNVNTLSESIGEINPALQVSSWEVGSVQGGAIGGTWDDAKYNNSGRLRTADTFKVNEGIHTIKYNPEIMTVTYKLIDDETGFVYEEPGWFATGSFSIKVNKPSSIGLLMHPQYTDNLTKVDIEKCITEGELKFSQGMFKYTPETSLSGIVQKALDSLDEVNPSYSRTNHSTHKVQMVGHRGLSTYYPENTLPAYWKAGEYGFYAVECDISPTSDGHFVLMHDDTVDRTTDGTGKVSDMTLEQIKQLVITGGSGTSKYPNLRVPTIEEFLEVCKKSELVPVIEIKTSISLQEAQTLIDIIRKWGFEHNAIFISFSRTAMENMRKVSKDVILQPILDMTETNIDYCASLGRNTHIDCSHSTVTKELVEYAHSKGVLVNCWTVNNVSRYQELVDMGVDFISTDNLLHNHKFSSYIQNIHKVERGTETTTITIQDTVVHGVDVLEISVDVMYKSGTLPKLTTGNHTMSYPENCYDWINLKLQCIAVSNTITIHGDSGQFEFRDLKVIHHKM